jgi:hypothetical protein
MYAGFPMTSAPRSLMAQIAWSVITLEARTQARLVRSP